MKSKCVCGKAWTELRLKGLKSPSRSTAVRDRLVLWHLLDCSKNASWHSRHLSALDEIAESLGSAFIHVQREPGHDRPFWLQWSSWRPLDSPEIPHGQHHGSQHRESPIWISEHPGQMHPSRSPRLRGDDQAYKVPFPQQYPEQSFYALHHECLRCIWTSCGPMADGRWPLHPRELLSGSHHLNRDTRSTLFPNRS